MKSRRVLSTGASLSMELLCATLPIHEFVHQPRSWSNLVVWDFSWSSGWCGSVGRALACKAKGHCFNSWSTCLGCATGPWQGASKKPIDVSLPHWHFSPSLPPSLPLSLKISKIKIKIKHALTGGSVNWAPACEPEGCQCNPVRAHAWVASQVWCFSPSIYPSLLLSLKANK